ncbi:MAG: HugZ family protein [Halothiobacillaceae bacterium]|nr:MAG: HugZ family protein [Halothiobacillaceae bacterium]
MAATSPSGDPGMASVQSDLDAFLSTRRSLVLGTRGGDGLPELSVAPFMRDGDGFVVFLSDLAPHTRNLRREPAAEVLLLEDEADARQPFARARVSLSCAAEPLDRASARGDALLGQMEAAFGGIIPLLRGLPDFHLFRLTPSGGRYVAGFGKAWRLSGLTVAEHLRH